MTDLTVHPHNPKAKSRGRIWLVVSFGVVVILLAATAIGASALLLKPHLPAPMLAKSEAANTVRVAAPLPGFQRRGATYTGEFTTRDGEVIHLVVDVRTQNIIGAKVIRRMNIE
jgi:hypothetical protein